MLKLVAGNWKMNGSLSDVLILQEIAKTANNHKNTVETVICVPAVFVHHFAQLNLLEIGGQNCHTHESGAYTGEISASMIKNVGANYVIVGHSERRIDCLETDNIVQTKAKSAFQANLKPIICVGETHDHYKQKISKQIVIEQIKNSVPITDKSFAIGYEPIWAIGTGLIPKFDEIAEIHTTIRNTLITLLGQDNASKVQILYGGSVKPNNAHDIAKINHVDGALVGGASLNANDFSDIMIAFS